MYKIINFMNIGLAKVKTILWYKFFFKKICRRSLIYTPILLLNPQYISIGKRSSIRAGARLEVVTLLSENPILSIGCNVNIEQNVHIVCGNEIVIGDNVSITANCALVDISHPYDDIYCAEKIGSRLNCSETLKIGDGSFIGIGSVILPGANIGKNCIIGANSVVTKPIPDYCIAVGNPARVIKKYDFEKKEWVTV